MSEKPKISAFASPIATHSTHRAMHTFSSPPSLYLSPRTNTLFVANRHTYANTTDNKAYPHFCKRVCVSKVRYATKNT